MLNINGGKLTPFGYYFFDKSVHLFFCHLLSDEGIVEKIHCSQIRYPVLVTLLCL